MQLYWWVVEFNPEGLVAPTFDPFKWVVNRMKRESKLRGPGRRLFVAKLSYDVVTIRTTKS